LGFLCTRDEEVKQEISCNEDPKTVPNGRSTFYLNNFRNFNQWSHATNFDIRSLIKTYIDIQIDEETPTNSTMNTYDINFRGIIHVLLYAENVQQYAR
jgi:hypothetical protein